MTGPGLITKNSFISAPMSLELRIKARDIALGETAGRTPAEFVLHHSSRYEPELLRLIAGHLDYLRTIEKKIPLWHENGKTLPYTGINLEQSSSELTARYKAAHISGENGLDLTGGLGVDSYFLSRKFNHFVHNEPDPGLSEVVRHNFAALSAAHLSFTCYKAEEYPWEESYFDWVYLDPSRRSGSLQKLVLPEDCLPDLPALRSRILEHSGAVMVKYSPMLDIKLALTRLQTVNEVWILAEKNEVKELVFILRKMALPHPQIRCVNLATTQPEFVFTYQEEKSAVPRYSQPRRYLYEPNACLLKGGAFNSIAARFNLCKIASNSHLYTNDTVLSRFPGRVMQITDVTSFDKKRLNDIVPEKQANIICRNFPLKPEEVRKKLQWKDGGDTYLYLTEDSNRKKTAIVATKYKTHTW